MVSLKISLKVYIDILLFSPNALQIQPNELQAYTEYVEEIDINFNPVRFSPL